MDDEEIRLSIRRRLQADDTRQLTLKVLRTGAVGSPRRGTGDAKEAFADALERGESSGAFGPEDEAIEDFLGGGESGGAFGPCVFRAD